MTKTPLKRRPASSPPTDLTMTGATADEIWPLVRDFHYSKRMPSAVMHCFAWREKGGLFGDTGGPLAGVVYSNPASRNHPQDALELTRLVRRDDFTLPLSKFVSWSLRWLRGHTLAPFVLSYADTTQGHHGGIYQACGFLYVGEFQSGHIGYNAEDGSFVHRRTCNARFGASGVEDVKRRKPNWTPVYGLPKHLYIKPIRQKTKTALSNIGLTAKSYPKPSAARPLDAPIPIGVSQVQPLGAAPTLLGGHDG